MDRTLVAVNPSADGAFDCSLGNTGSSLGSPSTRPLEKRRPLGEGRQVSRGTRKSWSQCV